MVKKRVKRKSVYLKSYPINIVEKQGEFLLDLTLAERCPEKMWKLMWFQGEKWDNTP